MRTAAVVNLKGGVGKSTTAINMALIMSQVHGKKVLLIDNDFQAAVTKFFEKHSYDALSMEEVLRNPILFAQDVIVPSGRWGLDIIPSNMNLVAAADDLITDKDGDQMGRIRHVLNQVEEDYDYCIIDCHPGVGIEVLNALAAAEDIIIPIKADKNALDGMEELDDIIQEIRPYNEKLESVRCLVTMYTRSVVKAELLEVSPCTFPAYDSSQINCRSFERMKADTKEEKRLEELRKEARLLEIADENNKE